MNELRELLKDYARKNKISYENLALYSMKNGMPLELLEKADKILTRYKTATDILKEMDKEE